MAPLIAPTASAEFLGPDLISSAANDHLLSGAEATEVRLLLVEDREVTTSLDSGGVKCVSMDDRKKRLTLSRGPASFSVKYDLLVVCRL